MFLRRLLANLKQYFIVANALGQEFHICKKDFVVRLQLQTSVVVNPGRLPLAHSVVNTAKAQKQVWLGRAGFECQSVVLEEKGSLTFCQIEQWLWLSCQTSCFQHHRSSIQIKTSANVYLEHEFTVNCFDVNVEKEAGEKLAKSRPMQTVSDLLDIGQNFFQNQNLHTRKY